MGRRPNEEKRRALARSAFEVMRARGLGETTMSVLAHELGVKRPTLYHYFPSRRAILEAVLEEFLSQERDVVLARVMAAGHPIDALYELALATQSFVTGRERDLVVMLQSLLPEQGEEGSARYLREINARFSVPRQWLEAQLDEAIASGRVAPVDAEALTRLVRAVNEGLLIQRVLEDEVPVEAIHELLWERLLKPLKIDPSESR